MRKFNSVHFLLMDNDGGEMPELRKFRIVNKSIFPDD